MADNKPEIIIALDGMEVNEALHMARLLTGKAWGFKVNDLLLEAGGLIITRLKKYGHVFADAKLHDTPNTVFNSVKKLSRAGADFISIHASADMAMLLAAQKAAGQSNLVGISVLTSNENFSKSTFKKAVFQSVVSRAYGIVCSPCDMKLLRKCPGSNALKVISPGIRPLGMEVAEDDQKRIATPADAAQAGADYIVVGRPVTGAQNSKEALDKIIKELEEMKTPQ
ncbi:MAG: orotidine 5'-phosphate decarboxylase [Candidatus Sungbacteria bacterium RIFCSPLOWO2_02_FULL_47_9]|uniref:Orotidine 5'-phosphate decarboxylase n=1 Tax=Candidatus Sungbacteria bacterium RIFCSPHIGHO2_01_FULL_47_32 TaxID=1802264 RepID=A0A1G2K7Z8_9BACT|nr:MAG: orotidine 5'-phosphate decarboxylase [Candidatus Sungbacteria bacterium RIFCSPHIGHO2_01_FULL_47_32]OGZ99546.1 MAG: orotidine 5'-phosphate decarboxylase [Candidatus Sungbacteria bacterium RIFCSPHIGHO2_02_FULL_46_12]OHA05203.1 MAG: orotidine 5'-phosphate decarboxylase [Candidatus Sungbacteria bacterium RIFCSPLOWO2_01_FULL_47_32]OHA11812.1 MAG: orotidine 5'-phosphate decarboxylase [Candidatus Sungbacteria bacterium RIFCSPLOWO2_02_FULL_47_9]